MSLTPTINEKWKEEVEGWLNRGEKRCPVEKLQVPVRRHFIFHYYVVNLPKLVA